MHTIIYSIREITSDQLPTIRSDDGVDRAATDAELLNFGFRRLDGDLFSCAEQFHSDLFEIDGELRRVWRHESEEPPSRQDAMLAPRNVDEAAALRPHGQLLSHGRLHERFVKLPAAIRERVLKAEVMRGKGKKDRANIAVADVDPDSDVVLESDKPPHHWQGER